MKKTNIIILIALGVIITTVALAQTKSTAPEAKFQYCELDYKSNWNSFTGGNTTRTVKISYPDGQKEEYKEGLVNGLNHLGAKGWELSSTYVDGGDGWSTTTYVFKKKL
jgi:adenosylcobinamide amidohydrolase